MDYRLMAFEIKKAKWIIYDVADKERKYLLRLARHAEEHGVNRETVSLIRQEAMDIIKTAMEKPQEFFNPNYFYNFWYAFKN